MTASLVAWASGAVVAAFALFLLGLAAAAIVRPSRAARFLSAFARSPAAHYGEQALRLVAGIALVLFAPTAAHPGAFHLLGWVLVATSLGLLCVPWTWHRRFARLVVPPVLRHLRLYGLGAALLGAFLLWSVVAGAYAST